MRKFMAIFLAVLMTGSLVACGGSSDGSKTPSNSGATSKEDFTPVKLVFGNQHPADSFMSALDQQICDQIAEATEGRVTVELHTDSSLGDYLSVYEEVMVGSIAMAHTTVPETYGAIMSASMAPYLGTDFETLKHAYRKDGYLYSAVEEALNGVGVHSFGFFCEGFNGIGTKVAVNQPAAIGVDKGVVVRVPAMDVHALGPLVLGYRTSTLSYSDTYTAIQTGVVDGWHSGPPNLNYLYFRDVVNYFYYYMMSQEATQIYINKDIFESLLPEDQEAITEIIDNALASTYELAAADDQKYMDLMAEQGIEVTTFTPEEIQSFADAVRTHVWPKLAQTMGEDFWKNFAADLGVEINF